MNAVPLVCFGFHVKTSLHCNGTMVPYAHTFTVFPVAASSPRVESPRSMTDSPSACNDPLGPPFSRLSGSLLLARCHSFRLNLVWITQNCWQEET